MTNHPNRGALPRPATILSGISKRYPGSWQIIDQFRADRGKHGLPDWPEWCYCPMAAAYAVVSGGGSLDDSLSAIADVPVLAALAAFRALSMSPIARATAAKASLVIAWKAWSLSRLAGTRSETEIASGKERP